MDASPGPPSIVSGDPNEGRSQPSYQGSSGLSMNDVASSASPTAALDAAMGRYAEGEDSAFTLVHAGLAPRLRLFLMRLAKSRPLADDLLQETFLRIHRARASFAVGARALPWGYAIARSVYIDHVRARAVRKESLSDRDFSCGFSEAVKVALLKDESFFHQIHQAADGIWQRDDRCWPIIEESARWHLRHITEGGDPIEMLEARPLDFGHWSAHKLETMANFELRHGEAVAIGLGEGDAFSLETLGQLIEIGGWIILAHLALLLSVDNKKGRHS